MRCKLTAAPEMRSSLNIFSREDKRKKMSGNGSGIPFFCKYDKSGGITRPNPREKRMFHCNVKLLLHELVFSAGKKAC